MSAFMHKIARQASDERYCALAATETFLVENGALDPEMARGIFEEALELDRDDEQREAAKEARYVREHMGRPVIRL